MLEAAINAWHTAVERRDPAAARAAVTDPVDVSGPRATGPIPAADFVTWIFDSGIRLRPLSYHPVTADTMVVEQEATWSTAPETAPALVATVFRVRDGAVALIHRFDDVHTALQAATPDPHPAENAATPEPHTAEHAATAEPHPAEHTAGH